MFPYVVELFKVRPCTGKIDVELVEGGIEEFWRG
jgi:hypothetical protein